VAEKQNFKMGLIEELSEYQTEILKALMGWDYSKKGSTAFHLNSLLKGSLSNTHINLRILNERGLVGSKKGSYFIFEHIKPKLVEVEKLDTSGRNEQLI